MPEPERPARTLTDLLWVPVNLVQVTVISLWTAFWITLALLVTLLTGSRRPSLWLARRIWAPGVLALDCQRLTVTGRERLAGLSGALVVANHTSYVDIPVLFAAIPRPLRFVAKRELARIPFLGLYIRAMGMVFLDRQAHQTARTSIGEAAALVRSGELVVTFPEGTRGCDGEVRLFRRGGFAAALDAGAPVVPVGIDGSGNALPARTIRGRPGHIRVTIGEPLPTAPFAPDDRTALAAAAQTAVTALVTALHTAARAPKGGG